MYSQREMIRVAKLYYEKGMTQQEIAVLENISRPTVSRILDAAIQEGIVTFSIQYPLESVDDLEEELKKRFELMKVCVAPVIIPEPSFILTDVGKLLSDYLNKLVSDGDTIGISWGNSLTYAAKQLLSVKRNNVRVVQLNGGVSTTAFSTGATNILDQFAKAFEAQPHALSVPTILDSREIASALLSDSSIRDIMAVGREANIAVFGIGRTSYQSVLNLAGYFKQDEYDKLLQKGAVGDICSRFYSIDGTISDEQLNDRTIGLHLEDLRRKKHTIAIACGEDKVPAVLGAVRGKYFNTLFTDENTARELIKQHDLVQTAEVQPK